MKNVRKIENIQKYVREQIILSGGTIYKAVKVAKIKAKQGKLGEKIITVMKDGHTETENIINKDPKTGELDWIITNPDGERYIIPDAIFRKKYEKVGKNTYKKKYCKVLALKLRESISFTTLWGKEMVIKKGGFLIISYPRDIYGIQKDEFFNTYKIINVISKEKVREKLLLLYYPELCDFEILTMKEKLKRIMLGQRIEGNIGENKKND